MSEKKVLLSANNERTRTSQKLYRYAHQLAQRLDLQLQNANEWKEFFDSETVLLRQRLKDTCEQLVLNGSTEISRRVEDLLWRKVFYDLIQKLRQDKKLLHSSAQLFTLYNAHLDAAHAFYHHLLFQIKEKFDLPIPNLLDWLDNIDSHKRKNEEKANDDVTMDRVDWAIKSCQRCLVFLGDIARYRMDIGYESALALAERYYHQAIWVYPESGMPHNQLGTLKQQANYHECEVAYHYLRCLVSVVSFDGAEENLKRTFERSRSLVKEDVAYPEGEKRSLVEQFLVEFLELQENFRYERLQSTEFSKICQSVIEKFADALNLSNRAAQSSSDGQGGNRKRESWTLNDLHERISDGLMVKLFVICIITVSDLFYKNSEIVSAAVAFMFTMLSKLLDYISRALAESPLSASVHVSKNRKDLKDSSASEGTDLQNGNEDLQLKKRKMKLLQRYRRRRRRKQLSNNEDSEEDGDMEDDQESIGDSNSDLSEGELLDQFLSSDENDEFYNENDDDHDESGGSTDTGLHDELAISPKSTFAKRRRENDRRKLRNLCEVGKLLSSQIQSQKNQLPRSGSRNSLWRSRSSSEASMDVPFEASLNCFTEFCYLQTFKVMTDWLRYAGGSMDIFEKDLSCVWQKVAKALNELPSHHLLLIVLQSLKRRSTTAHLIDASNPFSEQRMVLPEDKALIGLPFLTSLHKSLDYDWDSKTNYTVVIQFVIRVQSLKSFGKLLAEKIHMFNCDQETEKFHYGRENLESCGTDSVQEPDIKPGKASINDGFEKSQLFKSVHISKIPLHAIPLLCFMSEKKGNGRSQNELMKALAKRKLMHEVSELQDKMNLTGINKSSGMPPYLILDCPALCRHLSLIRSLAKSREFIMIVPIQTVQALDELKRYNPSAREAIKFLEEEFRQSSKWLRSQRDDETTNFDFNPAGKRKKNVAIDEWRFQQIIKCSLYFANKTGKANMVSILTSRNESTGSLGTRSTGDALDACHKNGIEVEPLADFYQRWVAKKST